MEMSEKEEKVFHRILTAGAMVQADESLEEIKKATGFNEEQILRIKRSLKKPVTQRAGRNIKIEVTEELPPEVSEEEYKILEEHVEKITMKEYSEKERLKRKKTRKELDSKVDELSKRMGLEE